MCATCNVQGGVPGVNLSVAPIDDNTKLALQVAVALLGVVGVAVGAPDLARLALPSLLWLSGSASMLERASCTCQTPF